MPDSFFAGTEHANDGGIEDDAVDAVESAGFPLQPVNGWSAGHWRYLNLDEALTHEDAVIADLAQDIRATGLLG